MENEKIVLPHHHSDSEESVLSKLPSAEDCTQTAELLKLVSEPNRLRIFWFLSHCEECVNNIGAAIGLSNQALSHHLKILKAGGLIECRRNGKEIYYKATDTQVSRFLHVYLEELLQITCPLS